MPWGDEAVASAAYLYPSQDGMIQMAQEIAVTSLASSGRITVVDSGSVSKLKNEYKLAANISGLKIRASNQGLNWLRSLDFYNSRWEVVETVKLRLEQPGQPTIESEGTGVSVGTIKLTSYDSGGTKFTSESIKTTPIGIATRNAFDDAVRKLGNRMGVSAKVAAVVTNEGAQPVIYISSGSLSGVHVGQEFEIFAPGSPGGLPTGHGKVLTVQPKLSSASPLDGKYAVGDTVKLLPYHPSKAKEHS